MSMFDDSGPDGVSLKLLPAESVKLGLYTLAGRQLIEHADTLRGACFRSSRMSYDEALTLFDRRLKDIVVRTTAPTVARAAEEFLAQLAVDVKVEGPASPRVAAIFEEVMAAIDTARKTWSAAQDFQTYKQIGMELAASYIADSNLNVTMTRLQRKALLQIGETDPLARADAVAQRGHGAAHLVTRLRQGKDGHDLILYRYILDHDIPRYMTLPFQFLHEYTAHVYSTDYWSEHFNDGWMLYVADRLFEEHCRKAPLSKGLCACHGKAFQRFMLPNVKGPCLAGYELAEKIDHVLRTPPGEIPGRFKWLTLQIVGFARKDRESEAWPTMFLNGLHQACDASPDRLKQLVGEASDARHLYSMLPQE